MQDDWFNMYAKVCDLCGMEFTAKYRRQRFCQRTHVFSCVVCGKQVAIEKDLGHYEQRVKNGTFCCCKSCSMKLAHKNATDRSKESTRKKQSESAKKYIAKHGSERARKTKATKLAKYGSETYNNREKYAITCQQKYGVDNVAKLNSTVKKAKQTKRKKYGSETYNNRSRAKQTSVQRYGVENAMQSDAIKQKHKQSVLSKYGSESSLGNKEVQQKSRNSLLSKYGVANASQVPESRDKAKQTQIDKYGCYYVNTKECKERKKAACLEKYGVDNPSKCEACKQKAMQTSRSKYGEDYPSQSSAVKAKAVSTCNRKYGVDYAMQSERVKQKAKETNRQNLNVDWPFASKQVQEKCMRTNLEKYGVEHACQSVEVKAKQRAAMLNKYGVDNPMKLLMFRQKAAQSAKASKLEKHLATLLDSYGIKYETQHVVEKNGHIHAFDFYVPDYKILVDADGKYYHSYLSDPDGKQVRDDYDEVRMYLVPSDHAFILAVEGHEDKAAKEVSDAIKAMDADVFDYDTDLFKWCREVGFPYPKYDSKRMEKDYNALCLYQNDKYKNNCRLGYSIIKNYHTSLYDCNVYQYDSPRKAWDDDEKLRRVILNRFIYKNNVDPSKVLAGFNISKTAPIVSIFNPVLAKHLVETYLSEFDEVFDPFSGFSGRLLGSLACGRKYIGQDIRQTAVNESNEIIKFLSAQSKASVARRNVLESDGSYPCLLTCPPYAQKETYGSEVAFKSCDEWIDECLQRFNCKAYVFVVDETEKYKQCVAETIQNSSHFSKAKEHVVVIGK